MSKKLMDPMTSLKTYWSLLKTLLNNKKVPCIPPLLQISKRNQNYLTSSSLSNALKYITLVNFL